MLTSTSPLNAEAEMREAVLEYLRWRDFDDSAASFQQESEQAPERIISKTPDEIKVCTRFVCWRSFAWTLKWAIVVLLPPRLPRRK